MLDVGYSNLMPCNVLFYFAQIFKEIIPIMFKFKIKYRDGDGHPVEIEITIASPTLTNAVAAAKIGVSTSQIISIRKV